jgi:predicted DNA-binding transcriptional regulator AlpA
MKRKVPRDEISPNWASSSSPAAIAFRAGHQRRDHRRARGGTSNDGDETPTPWNLAPEADRFLTSRQVRRRYGDSSDMWLWRRLSDQSGFPQPFSISGRRFWKLNELIAWERGHRAVAAQPSETSKPPKQSTIDSTFQRKAAADASKSPRRRILK